jgi:hypothetical protein
VANCRNFLLEIGIFRLREESITSREILDKGGGNYNCLTAYPKQYLDEIDLLFPFLLPFRERKGLGIAG